MFYVTNQAHFSVYEVRSWDGTIVSVHGSRSEAVAEANRLNG